MHGLPYLADCSNVTSIGAGQRCEMKTSFLRIYCRYHEENNSIVIIAVSGSPACVHVRREQHQEWRQDGKEYRCTPYYQNVVIKQPPLQCMATHTRQHREHMYIHHIRSTKWGQMKGRTELYIILEKNSTAADFHCKRTRSPVYTVNEWGGGGKT